MFCGSCGKQIPDGSTFCPACGAAAAGGAQPGAAATGASAGPSAAAAQRAKIEAQLKAGSQDAIQALKVLVMDPVGGLAKSYKIFDSSRALIVGAMFAGVFAIAAMIASLRGAGMMMGVMGGMGGGSMTAEQAEALARFGYTPPSTIKIMFGALIGAVVFAAVLIGVCALVRIVFKGTSDFAGDIYTAGASLLPWTVYLLIATILGALNLEILIIVGIFALTYSILMLYTGCIQIANISQAKAALAVPIMLVISFWLMSVVARAV